MKNTKTAYIFGGNTYTLENTQKRYFPSSKNCWVNNNLGYCVFETMKTLSSNIESRSSMSAEWISSQIDSIFQNNEKGYRIERKVSDFFDVTLRFINKKSKEVGYMYIRPMYCLLENEGQTLHFVVTAYGYNPIANVPTRYLNVSYQSGANAGVTIVEKVSSKMSLKNWSFLCEKIIYSEKPKMGGSLSSRFVGAYHTKTRRWNKTYEWSKSFRTVEDLTEFKNEVGYRLYQYQCNY